MRLVLDTCALVAFFEREPMRPHAVRAIHCAKLASLAYVPSVAAIELAQKSAAGKLRLVDDLSPRDYFARVLAEPGFREVSVSVEIALGAYELPGHFHKDPADRLIVATARLLDAPVVTIDRRILAYSQLGHVDAIAY